MNYIAIYKDDYAAFHELADAYYRDGEDADTPQEIIDSFVRMMFDKVINREIFGCFAKDGNHYAGFALWAVDTKDFEFSEMPGFGTILEIGLTPSYRSSGWGRNLVTYVETCLQKSGIAQCYVSAYGPAQKFWTRCGYTENGQTAGNGLPLMTKTIVAPIPK